MVGENLSTIMEDHALERVPDSERENWLKIAWITGAPFVYPFLAPLRIPLLVLVATGLVALIAGLVRRRKTVA